MRLGNPAHGLNNKSQTGIELYTLFRRKDTIDKRSHFYLIMSIFTNIPSLEREFTNAQYTFYGFEN